MVGSAAQSFAKLYRLLDAPNTTKGFAQLVALLDVLDCDVEVGVRARPAA